MKSLSVCRVKHEPTQEQQHINTDEDTSGYLSDGRFSPKAWKSQSDRSRPRMRLPNENLTKKSSPTPFVMETGRMFDIENGMANDDHNKRSRRDTQFVANTKYFEESNVDDVRRATPQQNELKVDGNRHGHGRKMVSSDSVDNTDRETDFNSIPKWVSGIFKHISILRFHLIDSHAERHRQFHQTAAVIIRIRRQHIKASIFAKTKKNGRNGPIAIYHQRNTTMPWWKRMRSNRAHVGWNADSLTVVTNQWGECFPFPNTKKCAMNWNKLLRRSYSFIRGQNAPIDANTLAERTTKRMKAIEFQNAIKEQLKEREAIKRLEHERILLEERRQEDRVRKQMEAEQMRVEAEQLKQQDKIDSEIKKQKAMKMAIEKARLEAELEKARRRRESHMNTDSTAIERNDESNDSFDAPKYEDGVDSEVENGRTETEAGTPSPTLHNGERVIDEGEKILIGTPIKMRKKTIAKLNASQSVNAERAESPMPPYQNKVN